MGKNSLQKSGLSRSTLLLRSTSLSTSQSTSPSYSVSPSPSSLYSVSLQDYGPDGSNIVQSFHSPKKTMLEGLLDTLLDKE